jgi:hypothetical protein
MHHGHCLRLVLLLLVIICTMLLNMLEQALTEPDSRRICIEHEAA